MDAFQHYAVQRGQGNLRFSSVWLNRCVRVERVKLGLAFVNMEGRVVQERWVMHQSNGSILQGIQEKHNAEY